MARGPRYHVLFRRRRTGKTNFYYRKRLILSNRLRFVVRTSLKHIMVQTIKAELIGDKILCSANSKELIKSFNWKGGSGNLPTAYLVGFLAGKKAIKNDCSDGVLDIGIKGAIRGNRLFAALKGIIDAGVEIPIMKKFFPPKIESEEIM